MKKILIPLLFVAVTPAVFGQYFLYDNLAAHEATGKVVVNIGTPVSASVVSIDIFWGAIGTSETNLVSLGQPALVGDFSGYYYEGYYQGGIAVIPVAGEPTSVLIQYRAVTPGYFGKSAIVTQPVSYVPAIPFDAVLPPSWTIVPEPSAFALVGLGGAILIRGRRNNPRTVSFTDTRSF
jgi:hypothetical protein